MRFSHCVILRLTARYMPFVIQTNYNSPLHTSAVLITVNKRSYIVYKETDCLAAEILPHIIYNTNTYSDLPKVTNTTQGFGSFNNKIVWSWIVIDSLWIRPTDVLNSNFIGITTLHVSGSLSAHHQEFSAVHRLGYILCSCDDRLLSGVGWKVHPTPGSKRFITTA